MKGLEVEIGELLKGFRASVAGRNFAYDQEDHAESSLTAYLAGQKPPTLGAIPYLLRRAKADASELRLALDSYINGLPNAEFLTSSKFVKSGLQRVINKYRNGGAHDLPISEKVCRECVEELLGNADDPGFIPRVVAWKSRAAGPETSEAIR